MPGEQVAAAYAKISLDAAEFHSGLKQAESAFSSFARNVESTGSKIAGVMTTIGKGVVAGITAAGAATLGGVKAFADFEKGLASVSKTTGLAGKELDALGESLRELSRQTPVTVTDLEKIASTAGSLGIGAQKIASGDLAGARAEIIEFTKTISDMAIAFDMTADTVAPMIGAIANVYKLPTNELALFGSQVNALENTMNATAPQILEFVNAFGGTASMFGESASKTAAFGAVLNSLGINGAEAATQLRSGILQLLQSYEVSESAVKKYAKEHNVSMEQAAEALKINQKNVEKLAQVMGVSADEIRRRLNEDLYGSLVWIGTKLKDIQGDTEAAAIVSQIFGTYGYQAMMKLGASAETYDFALKQINTDSKGLAREADVMANTISGQWARLKNNVIDVAIEIGKIASGPVRDLLSFLNDQAIPAVKDFFKALVSGDWNKVFDMIKSAASTALEEAKRIATTVIDTIKNTDWGAIWSGLKSTAATAWDGIKSLATEVVDAIRNVDWDGVWSSLKSAASTAWDEIKSLARGAYDAIRNIDWGAVWETLKTAASRVWDEIKSLAQSAYSAITSIDWGGVWNTLKEKANTAFEEVKRLASSAWDEIKKAAETIDWQGLGDKIGGLIKKGVEAAAKLNEALQQDVANAINQGKFEDLGVSIGEKLVGGIQKILGKAGETGGLWGVIQAVLGEASQWFQLGVTAAKDLVSGFAAAVAVPLFDAIVDPIIAAVTDILDRLGGVPVVGEKFTGAAEYLRTWKSTKREELLNWQKSVAQPGRSAGEISFPSLTGGGAGGVGAGTQGVKVGGTTVPTEVYSQAFASGILAAGFRSVSGKTEYYIKIQTPEGPREFVAPYSIAGMKELILKAVEAGVSPEKAYAMLTQGRGQWSEFLQNNPEFAQKVMLATGKRIESTVERLSKAEEEAAKTTTDAAQDAVKTTTDAAEEEAKTTTDAAEDAAKTTTEAAKEEVKTEQTSAQNAAQVQQNAAQNFAQKAMAAAEEYRQKTLAAGNSVVGAAQYAETSLKLGAEVGGKFMTDAGQAVVVKFDEASNQFSVAIGSAGTSLKQTAEYNKMKAEEMGAVIVSSGQSASSQLNNAGSNTSSKLMSGGTEAYSRLLSGGMTAMQYLNSGGSSVYQKLASIPDPGVKIVVAAEAFASKVVSAANYFAGRILRSATAAGYAEGGIVSTPTYGLIGEAGAEAIVPLDNKAAGWKILSKILPRFGVRLFAEGGIVGGGTEKLPEGSETVVASITLTNISGLVAEAQKKLTYLKNYFRKTWDIIRAESISSWRKIISDVGGVWSEFVNTMITSTALFRTTVSKFAYDTAMDIITAFATAQTDVGARIIATTDVINSAVKSSFDILNSYFENFKSNIWPGIISSWQTNLQNMANILSSSVSQMTTELNKLASLLSQIFGRSYNFSVGGSIGGGIGGGGGGGVVSGTGGGGGSQLVAEEAFLSIGGTCEVEFAGTTPGLHAYLYQMGYWKPNEYELSKKIFEYDVKPYLQQTQASVQKAASSYSSSWLPTSTVKAPNPASAWSSSVTPTSGGGVRIGSTTTRSVIKLGKYQEGGIARTPQLAMIAENGPEMVLPVKYLSGGENKIEVNVYLDGKKISSNLFKHATNILKTRGLKL